MFVLARRHNLPFLTAMVESQLYKATPTMEEYYDLTTLSGRVAGALTAYFIKQKVIREDGRLVI